MKNRLINEIQKQRIGEYEDLSKLWNNNINYKIDYRSLYEFVLRQHFNIKDNPFSNFHNEIII